MTEQNSGFQSFPSWESLCQFRSSPSLSASERLEVENLKRERPGWFYQLVRLGLSLSSAGYTSKKFLHCDWSDIVDIIHDQAVRNRELMESGPEGFSPEYDETLRDYVNREHNQLPCTMATVSRRVDEARKWCGYQDPVLVLGDDDMLGVALVKAGFQDVTSVDIDEQICQELKERAGRQENNLKVLCHDISNPPPRTNVRPYRLIFLDPMYSLGGIRLFTESALRFSDNRQNTLLFMSLHLMSLLRPGFDQLPEIFDNYGLRWEKFYGGFNAYPIPTGLARWIKLFNRRFMRTNLMSSEGYMFRFFLSDAMLLRKGNATR